MAVRRVCVVKRAGVKFQIITKIDGSKVRGVDRSLGAANRGLGLWVGGIPSNFVGIALHCITSP